MAASRYLVALAGIAGGAALALFGPRPPGEPKVAPKSVADELDRSVREMAAALHSRATTLGDLPRLAAAVSTDATTVRDLTQDELAFRPKPGETITIGQLPRKDGAPMVLLTLPDGASALPIDKSGSHLEIVDGKLRLLEQVTVVPRARADELTGAIAIAWPFDTTPFVERLDRDGIGGKLTIGGATLDLGKHKVAADEPTTAVELAADKAAKLVLFVPLAPPPTSPFVFAGIGLGVVGILLSFMVGRKKPEAAPAITSAPEMPARTSTAEMAVALAGTAAATPAVPRPSTASGAPVDPTAGTAVALAADVGATVGRYTIIRKLGSGGMAEVFLARASGEAGFEKLIALKVLHRNMAGEAIVVEHFLDEARLASRLTHPNIVQITDLGKAGDEYFIAMEYIEGSDLERLLHLSIERGQLVPLRVALAILRKICDGLHAAHTAAAPDGKPLDLVHRDVKSANVFVARNGAVKVGDFGIAKANTEGRVNKTAVGMVKGTAAYMAPEQRVGKAIDKRADLYAVGAIAYEILTGQEVNLDLAMLADKGREGWPHLPRPSTLRRDLPPELDAIVWKCLAYEPKDRYDDCGALEEQLEQVAAASNSIVGEKAIAQWVESLLGRPDASATLKAATAE